MNKNIYRLSFYIILLLVTYLFYILPFEILNELLFNQIQSFEYSLINTLIFYILILYYLRSHNTFKPLKIFVYEGLGIGFISFMVISTCVIFNSVLQINTFFILRLRKLKIKCLIWIWKLASISRLIWTGTSVWQIFKFDLDFWPCDLDLRSTPTFY